MTDSTLLEPAAPPAPPSAPTGPLADLVLVRLLPAGKAKPSPKRLTADLSLFFPRPLTAGDTADALTTLRAAGLLAPKGQHLTDAGRARALAYLGVAELPARTTWGTVKAKYLVPKALGLAATAEDAALVGTADKAPAQAVVRPPGRHPCHAEWRV